MRLLGLDALGESSRLTPAPARPAFSMAEGTGRVKGSWRSREKRVPNAEEKSRRVRDYFCTDCRSTFKYGAVRRSLKREDGSCGATSQNRRKSDTKPR